MNDYRIKVKEKLAQMKGHRVFLYGAKNLGDIASKLLKYYGVDVGGFIISGTPGNAELNGLNIYSFDDYVSDIRRSGDHILLTLNPMFHDEIRKKLTGAGIDNIDDSFSEYQVYFFADSYEKIFRELDISVDGELLTIGDCSLRNPYINPELENFFLEAGDLVLPELLNNYDYINEGSYEFEKVFVSPGDVVVDCGANIGLFSAYAASKGAERIYAFEPLAELGTVLERQSAVCRNKGQCGITLCTEALSDKCGSVVMNVSSFSDADASIVSESHTDGKVTVDTLTLDEAVKKYGIEKVDLIKADIEGAERLMLRGAYETLRTFSPKLAICTYHLPDDPQVLEEIIRSADPRYKVVHKWKKLYAWVE